MDYKVTASPVNEWWKYDIVFKGGSKTGFVANHKSPKVGIGGLRCWECEDGEVLVNWDLVKYCKVTRFFRES